MTTTTLTAGDQLALQWYLARFAWAMQDYPQREYRRIRDDLRRDTRAAATEVGMPEALRGLGDPRLLAERYVAETGRRLPRWTSGIVAAGFAVLALSFVVMAYAAGVLDALAATGTETVTMSPFGQPVTYTATADQLSVAGTYSWPWLVLYAAVAGVTFALVARVWRAWRRKAGATGRAPG
ncbi:MAG TPA: hypothetical protein PKB06_13045 [Actinotalea sp.]|nr:hypothetical protein [Actinotalea sp.]